MAASNTTYMWIAIVVIIVGLLLSCYYVNKKNSVIFSYEGPVISAIGTVALGYLALNE